MTTERMITSKVTVKPLNSYANYTKRHKKEEYMTEIFLERVSDIENNQSILKGLQDT